MSNDVAIVRGDPDNCRHPRAGVDPGTLTRWDQGRWPPACAGMTSKSRAAPDPARTRSRALGCVPVAHHAAPHVMEERVEPMAFRL